MPLTKIPSPALGFDSGFAAHAEQVVCYEGTGLRWPHADLLHPCPLDISPVLITVVSVLYQPVLHQCYPDVPA